MSGNENTENKQRVLELIEDVFGTGQLDRLPDYFSPDYFDHGVPPGAPNGIEGAKFGYQVFRDAFPDYEMTIEDVIAGADKVVTRRRYRGTHTGPLMGLPPTGRKAEWTAIDINRMVDGKIIERWTLRDDFSLLQQLGVIPPVGQERPG